MIYNKHSGVSKYLLSKFIEEYVYLFWEET